MNDKEFESLSPRVQDQVRRHAAASANNGMFSYFSPAQLPTRFRRVGKCLCYNNLALTQYPCDTDWLRDKVFFEKLVRRDQYAKSRLGFSAPNIFVMLLNS